MRRRSAYVSRKMRGELVTMNQDILETATATVHHHGGTLTASLCSQQRPSGRAQMRPA